MCSVKTIDVANVGLSQLRAFLRVPVPEVAAQFVSPCALVSDDKSSSSTPRTLQLFAAVGQAREDVVLLEDLVP